MRKWTEPVNLNPPVNSSVDDLYYVLLNNSEGFFVSNRGNNSSSLHSTCCDDIFAFAYNANKEIELLTESINNSDTITISQVEMEMMKQETFVLNNIYYEFDKSELTADAKKVIDSTLLVILKKEPDISLQINSFTDNLGNNEYNLELSNQRTQSVVNYLISKGISKNRLITTAFGEIVPMVDNFYSDGSDNPEGREMNRRTEFRILLNNSYLAEIIKKENNFP
ncbi:MAG: OmpA family protein [Bacteroidia bacterium]|nr:OmpA family protein [Bacteroidia bacterium]